MPWLVTMLPVLAHRDVLARADPAGCRVCSECCRVLSWIKAGVTALETAHDAQHRCLFC